MSAKPSSSTPSTGSARARRGSAGLAVSGVIPAALDGSLLQAAVQPGWSAGAGCAAVAAQPLLDYGIRLSGGRAHWYRTQWHRTQWHRTQGPRTQGHRQGAALRPATTVPRVTRVCPGSPGPDGVGASAVARPVPDPHTGEWHTVATYPGLGHAEHLRLGADGQVRHAEAFALDGAPLIHAVAATERYVVVFDLPVTHRRAAALLGARFPYAWQAGRPARLGLLAHGSDQARWFDIRPCYVFNAVNAYYDGDRVVVDAVRHERAFDHGAGRLAGPRLWRWTLDLRTGTADERRLATVPMEWPEVDPAVRGHRHRYVFGARPAGPVGDPREPTATALVRHDLVTGATQLRMLPPGHSAGQPVFIPRPPAGEGGGGGGGGGRPAEGDGWLVSMVHDLAADRTDLLILDAGDLQGPAVATVHLPVRLPASLHTYWQPA
jgi:carotenoid cleavage dioxygenase-like enzyme